MPRREYAGGAVQTTLVGAIDGSATSLSIADNSGWPTGAGGPFSCVIDRGTADEEKIECSLQTGSNVTIQTRGFDGTTGTSHGAGAAIEVIWAAVEADEVNRHAFDTGQDDHTQYLNSARHGSILHDTSLIADGAITQPKLAKPAVGGPEIIDGAVDNDALATNAVTSDKIADGEVSTADLKDLNVTEGKLAAGAVTTDKLGAGAVTAPKTSIAAIDSTTGALTPDAVDTVNIQDGKVTEAKLEDTQRTYVVANFAALPAAPATGAQGFTTDKNRLYLYDGTSWFPYGGPRPTFEAGTTTNQSIPVNTPTTVTMTVSTDTDSFDGGASLFQVPTELPGLYLVTYFIQWEQANDPQAVRQSRLWKNGLTSISREAYIGGGSSLFRTTNSWQGILAAGDTLALQVEQAEGAGLETEAANWQITWLGPPV